MALDSVESFFVGLTSLNKVQAKMESVQVPHRRRPGGRWRLFKLGFSGAEVRWRFQWMDGSNVSLSFTFPASSVNLRIHLLGTWRFLLGPAPQDNSTAAMPMSMSAMFDGVRGNSYKVSTVSDGGLRYD